MRSEGRTVRRLRKLAWALRRPQWATRNGVMLPVRNSLISRRVAREIFLGDYEKKEVAILDAHLAADDVVFEVGTGIGFLSTFCARRLSSAAVFTYEANPALIPVIQSTFDKNGVRPTLTNAMLATGDGEHDFVVDDDFWASSAHRTGGGTIRVPQVDLNIELGRIRPTFLIVDIEGGEAEFLATANLATVRKICLETHPDVLSDATLSGMLHGLLNQGFVLEFATANKGVLFLQR